MCERGMGNVWGNWLYCPPVDRGKPYHVSMSNAIVPSGKKKSGVDNTSRRTWDKEEFRVKADARDRKEKETEAFDARKRKRLERDPLHNGIIVERSELKQRDFQIDLASRLGKTQVRMQKGEALLLPCSTLPHSPAPPPPHSLHESHCTRARRR